MAKICIHTYDIFDIKDATMRSRYFDFCHKKALNCGLVCRCIIRDSFTKLELWGTKRQFLKYYFQTMTNTFWLLEFGGCDIIHSIMSKEKRR